ncbi:metallophosphoesterase [soil metagenome]
MLLLCFTVLALAIFGHLLITRASMGFGYTFGIRRHGWHVLMLAHAVVGIVAPIVLIIFIGLRGPAILRTGNLADVPWPWMIYIAICLIAIPFGAVVMVRRHLSSVPAVLRSNHTMSRNATSELGRIPAPRTLAGKLARISGNECFRVDFRTLDVTLPQLPRALDGISILHLTDLHFIGTPDRTFFEWAARICDELKPDLIALTGDIADRVDLLDWLPTTLGKIHAPLGRFFILGNHDLDCHGEQIRDAMEQIGWRYIGSRCVTVEHAGRRILLAGTELPWAGEHPTIDDAARVGSTLRILLTHLPQEVWWARRHQFDLALAGHLHGGQIRFPFFGPIIGGRFASGLFHLEPTVLHVGRGLGAMVPLRFGCPPDVAKLVLRSPV